MFLSDMAWPEVDAISRDVIVVCAVSALEQHGPHLPLGTDHMLGTEIVRRIEARMPDRLLCLPTVWFGCSSHHMSFAGTVSVSVSTMQAVLRDTVSSVLRHGFRKVLFLNSHGGNRAMLACSIQQLGEEFPDAVLVGATYWDLVNDQLWKMRDSEFGGMGHACELETSILLCLAPRLVDMTKAVRDGRIAQSKYTRSEMLVDSAVSIYRPMSAITQDGTFGDPRSATAEKGERFLTAITDAVESLCADIFADRI
jgi:creatinine amidohydrolase